MYLFLPAPGVPRQKTVTGTVSSVTEPDPTLPAEPAAIGSSVGQFALSTSSPLVACVENHLQWEVTEGEWLDGGALTARSATTTIVTNQLLC